MNNEQWISGGNCDLCRRKRYCNKPCKEAERTAKRKLTQIVMYEAAKIVTGAFHELNEELGEKDAKKK